MLQLLARQRIGKPIEGQAPWVSRFHQHMLGSSKSAQIALYTSLKCRLSLRDRFASKHLHGRGIELGAQMIPTKTRATVEYVDVLSNEALESRYNLPVSHLVPLTHVIDGNNLSVYRDGELDFLIANHVLEHFDDPVGGLVEWLRILKHGGRLFITLPNHRSNCYDWQRVPARYDHLERDYVDPVGRPERNLKHYEDFAQAINQWSDGDPRIIRQAMEWTEANDRHHYHVYDEQTVTDVLTLAARHSGCGLRLVASLLPTHGFEFLVVVEKTAGDGLTGWPSRWFSKLSAGYHLTTGMIVETVRFLRR